MKVVKVIFFFLLVNSVAYRFIMLLLENFPPSQSNHFVPKKSFS